MISQNKRRAGDIDIDLSDRTMLLKHIIHIPAAMRNVKPIRKHSTGIYVTKIPYDPVNNMAAIDYVEAETRGYVKLDLLNVHVYSHVRDEEHLVALMREPNWDNLRNKKIVKQLVHLSNHYSSILRMPEPIDNINKLAMFLAIIRPAKKHLIGKTWEEVSNSVWDTESDGYVFKRSHSLAYSQLVAVNMNLIDEGVVFNAEL